MWDPRKQLVVAARAARVGLRDAGGTTRVAQAAFFPNRGRCRMYMLFRSLSTRELAFTQLPLAATSMMVAELFYRFGSFTLEAVAFLATWFALDLMMGWARAVAGRGSDLEGPSGKR